MEAKRFINLINSETFSKIRNSQGDAECRRLLKELLRNMTTVKNIFNLCCANQKIISYTVSNGAGKGVMGNYMIKRKCKNCGTQL